MADDVIGKLVFKVETDTTEAKKNVEDFNSSMEDTQKIAEETDEKMGKSSEGISAKWLGVVAAVGAAVVKLVGEISKATAEIEDGRKNIVNATGATGDALDGLMESAKTVFQRNEDSFDDVTRAIGEISTRLKLTGGDLEDTTELFLDFADVTGQDVQQSIVDVTKVMNQWGMDTEDIPDILDKLTTAGQESGASVDELSGYLTDNAGVLQALGYDFDDAIALFEGLETQGINTSDVIMGMKKSFEDSATAGSDAQEDWQNLMGDIKNATDETDAYSKAVDVFGGKIATDMVKALQGGAFEVEDFKKGLENAEGALKNTAEAGKTTGDRIQTLKNQVKVAMANIGTAMAPVVADILPTLSGLITTIFDAIKPLTPMISSLFKAISRGIQTAMTIIEPFITVISNVIGWISSLITKVMDAITWLNKLHNQNPDHAKETGIAVWAEDVEETPEEFLARMEAQGFDTSKLRAQQEGHPMLSGSQYIPYDGYPASLHRGEMVLNRADAERFRDLGGMYGLEQTASLPLGSELGAVNINNQLSAVIEVDGTQLGIAVLRNIDKASQFVLR